MYIDINKLIGKYFFTNNRIIAQIKNFSIGLRLNQKKFNKVIVLLVLMVHSI